MPHRRYSWDMVRIARRCCWVCSSDQLVEKVRSWQRVWPKLLWSASCVRTPPCEWTGVTDFVIGAQHLQGNGDVNIQPLGRQGSALGFAESVNGHCSYATGGDWHDANRETPLLTETRILVVLNN